MKDYKLYIQDMLEAIKAIEKFVDKLDFEAFLEDDKTSSAVIRKFEIIGEATKNIPQKIRKNHPDIPWQEMAGMRDKLIHFYFGIDYNLVWQTIKNRLPKVKAKIKKILEEI